MWRGDGRSEHRWCRPFRLAVPYEPDHGSVSTSRSSNRTCRSPASGSRTRLHAFAHERLRPLPSQSHEPESVVEDRGWIAPAPLSAFLELGPQPPAQPRNGVAVDRPVSVADRAYLEVVRPAAQRAIQLAHQLRGLLPRQRRRRLVIAWSFSTMRRMLCRDGRMPR